MDFIVLIAVAASHGLCGMCCFNVRLAAIKPLSPPERSFRIRGLRCRFGFAPCGGYQHEVTYLKGNTKTASELLPRVHLVISHLKRWMMGTHQGAISHKHLDYYLDEFTFRFNRRRSKSRGKLFFRLAQQAVAVDPVTLDQIIHPDAKSTEKPQPVGHT
jgi:hypothetical protein